MSGRPVVAADHAADLRRAFDESFARAAGGAAEPYEDLLAVRIAGNAFAIRRTEIAALVAGLKVLALPGPSAGFLGVVGFRGLVVPVYGLRALLGYPRGDGVPWVVVAASEDRVGLAFDRYEGFLRVPAAQVVSPDRSEEMSAHVRAVARQEGSARPVLDLPALLDTIKRRIRPGGPSKEK